jgi:hypothetical protein
MVYEQYVPPAAGSAIGFGQCPTDRFPALVNPGLRLRLPIQPAVCRVRRVRR